MPHPKVNQVHIYVYFVSRTLFFFSFLTLSFREAGPTWSTFPASADKAIGILVKTGNSVDYSLAIRLLSLQWLSLLHHEIAWLSARLESVLCSNPPAHPHPLTRHPFAPPSHPSLSFPHLEKKAHLAPLRSARQCRGKTG